MNKKRLVSLTNRLALLMSGLLIYWVFIFITVTVFNLKIFRERMTEVFALCILGIFAILGGALILNIMFNLTRIADGRALEELESAIPTKSSRIILIVALALFPLIFGGLMLGNHLSNERKKEVLVSTAETMIRDNATDLAPLGQYEFSEAYLTMAKTKLTVLSRIDKHFLSIKLIVPDKIDSKDIFLAVGQNVYTNPGEQVEKLSYIQQTTEEERNYLKEVFFGNERSYKFTAKNGTYELFYPTMIGNKLVVIYFTDYQQYGKLGS